MTAPHRNNPDKWQPYIWACSKKGYIESLQVGHVSEYRCFKSYTSLLNSTPFSITATFAEAQAAFEDKLDEPSK